MQDRGDQCAKSDRKEPVVRHHSQELVQLTSGRFLHAVAHNAHAVQEHTETAQETEDTFQISDIHNVFSILFCRRPEFREQRAKCRRFRLLPTDFLPVLHHIIEHSIFSILNIIFVNFR